jgi:predicted negative regulator of RcsB-dependent stress response
MDYQQYHDIAHEAARLFEAGDFDGALAHFLSLMESDISDLDKAAMCQNIARVCEKQGRMDEAMEWYDQGVGLEQPHCRHLVAETRAGALHMQGRQAESLAAYQMLLRSPSTTEEEKNRYRHNIAALEALQRQ